MERAREVIEAAHGIVVDFWGPLVEPIKSGRKRATTRWGIPEIATQTPFELVATSDGSAFGVLRVTAIETRSEVDDELASIEDMPSAQALMQLLRKFYPDLPEQDANLKVFYFEMRDIFEEPLLMEKIDDGSTRIVSI